MAIAIVAALAIREIFTALVITLFVLVAEISPTITSSHCKGFKHRYTEETIWAIESSSGFSSACRMCSYLPPPLVRGCPTQLTR